MTWREYGLDWGRLFIVLNTVNVIAQNLLQTMRGETAIAKALFKHIRIMQLAPYKVSALMKDADTVFLIVAEWNATCLQIISQVLS